MGQKESDNAGFRAAQNEKPPRDDDLRPCARNTNPSV